MGHASTLNKRIAPMLLPEGRWHRVSQPFAAAQASWLHIGPLAHEARLLDFLSVFRGGVSMLLPHAFPHDCPQGRRRMLLAIYRRCRLLLVPTQKVADTLAVCGIQPRCIYVLGGYPCEPMRTLRPVASGGPCRLLMCGYLDRDSGADRLPLLLQHCRRNRLTVHLTAAGCMDESLAARLAAAGATVHRGFLGEGHFHTLLRQADMLLLPYRKQVDTPQIHLAMEHGLPVLRTPQVADWNGGTQAPGAALPWQPAAWCLALQEAVAKLNSLRTQALAYAAQSRQRLLTDMPAIRAALQAPDMPAAEACDGGLNEWSLAGNPGRAGAFQPCQGFAALD